MIKKIQLYFNLILILIFVIAIIFFIYNSIVYMFHKPKAVRTSDIQEYVKEDNVVNDYGLFYTLEGCSTNFIEACMNEQYTDLYKLLYRGYNRIYSKSDLEKILKNYNKEYFLNDYEEGYYVAGNKLLMAYRYNDGYILKLETANEPLYLIVFYDVVAGNAYKYIIVEK